jgi:energy-coupling factor transporter transmembrane protein EcfT
MDLMRSLEQQCKLPVKFAYGLLAAWGILPTIQHEYRRTKAAFYARGLYPQAFSPALLIPLFIKAVRWSEALAIAMESKGFGEQPRRTRYYEMKVSVKDVFFVIACCALMTCGVIMWRA